MTSSSSGSAPNRSHKIIRNNYPVHVHINSLVPEKCGSKLEDIISEQLLRVNFESTFAFALSWIPQTIFDDKGECVQVISWSRQETNSYLRQFWTKPMLSFGHNKYYNYWICIHISLKFAEARPYFFHLVRLQTLETMMHDISPAFY